MTSPYLALFFVSFAVQALADITWNKPEAGDVYTPGDSLKVVWTTTDAISSPSFTICRAGSIIDESDSAGCGEAMWPPVDKNGTKHSISLAVPNVVGMGDHYLVMKDDQGMQYETPIFSLALSKVTNTSTAVNTSSGITSTGFAGTSNYFPPSHSASTIVAIAVPLSVVAATLLMALMVLLFRWKRTRRHEKDKKSIYENPTSQSTVSFSSATDIERAVMAIAASRGYGPPGPHYYAPAQPVNPGHSSAAKNFAAALGLGAFGWAHGFGAPPNVAPAIPDHYTPVPLPQYAAGPDGNLNFAQQSATILSSAPTSSSRRSSQFQHGSVLYDQEVTPRRTDWRSTDRMFANDSGGHSQSYASGPPQLPEIRPRANSPLLLARDSPPPPPPPPKPLRPGSSLDGEPCPYDCPFAPQPPQRLSPYSGIDAHTSLSVISDYMQASPVPPGGPCLAPPGYDFQAPRAPPSSVTRVRSLRRLETIPEDGVLLPTRPEDRVGTSLYAAVSEAVGR